MHVGTTTRWRFSLRTLLGLTTLAALTIGLAQLTRGYVGLDMLIPHTLVVASVAVAMAGITLLGVWLLLQDGSPILRSGVFAILAGTIGVLPTYACHRDGDLALIVTWGACHAALVAATLLVLRCLGTRLVIAAPSPFARLVRVVSARRLDAVRLSGSTDQVTGH